MENEDKIEDMKKYTEKKPFYKNGLFFLFLLIFFSAAAFIGGMMFAVRNDVVKEIARKDLTYIGQITGKYTQDKNGILAKDVDFNLFWDVWKKLEELYVDKDKINEKVMFYGAIKGLVASVGDPYTVFMEPIIAKEFSDDLAGTFEGIGAEVGIKNDILTIISPLPDMPAEKSGLKAGDKVYAIDNEPTSGLSVDEAVRKIRGPKDTNVILTILRDGAEATKDYTITRGAIAIKSIITTERDDGIFVIKVTNFNNDTEILFNEAIATVIEKKSKGIILDLRNNPGGYLETAIEMTSEWIEKDVVVIEKFSDDKKNEYLSRGRARMKNIPTVVLVNEGSASASEIVAGALQDKHQGKIVGQQTFGKGSVQTLENFGDGSSLKVTVAKWLTPNGRSINEEGIMPDVTVDYTLENYEKDEDPQFDKAVEMIKSGEAFDFSRSAYNIASTTENK
jgi:carboxyl-terminal processing protease